MAKRCRKDISKKKGTERTAKKGRNGKMEIIVPFSLLLDNKI
jgi:hypothetical protein